MKIYFITQGCSANVADSEVMQGLLVEAGHEIVCNLQDSDLVIINSCTVKGPTEVTFKRKLQEAKTLKKKIVVTGCLVQSQKLKEIENISKVGTYQIKRIVEAVDATSKGKVVELLDRTDEGRLNVSKKRKNSFIEIVPISQGCLNACTYCKTKHARGELHSYPIKDIVRHISKAVEEGAKEIWLTSQDNAVYGFDIKTNLAKLLKEIVSIPREFKIRVGMANPGYLLDFIDELIEVYKNDKIFNFIHVPVQSGSDKVLKDMNRGYKVEDFVKVVSKFKNAFPMISVCTDIIVAYPTETKQEFKETINLLNKTRPDMINTSRFWSRPGTPASLLKGVDGKESKERAKIVMDLFRKLGKEENSKWLNKTCKIMIVEKGKNNTFIGKNESYKQVLVKGKLKMGQEVNVKITDVTSVDLRGEILSSLESK